MARVGDTATKTLPQGWQLVRFGDVVRNVDINDRNPLENGLERYIGLEHIDPESLHIKRWGLIEEGTSFTRKFVKGQVLFGKRRAYQRKVAVAEFDGICSGDILVFEPKNDQLISELLPFIVQSDGFLNHALGTSAGSLSPRTKWKDLAAYEFALPPKDEQRRIAEILWAAEESVQADKAVVEQLEVLTSTVFEAAVTRSLKSKSNGIQNVPYVSSWKMVKLGELLLAAQYGTSKRAEAQKDNTVPVLRIPNVVSGGLELSDLSWVALTQEEQERYAVHPGDILLVRTNGNPLYVGRSVVIRNVPVGIVFASYLIRLRVDESRIRPEYLNVLLNSEYLRKTLSHEIRSSAGNYNINTEGLKRQKIPLPPIDEQDQLLKMSKSLDESNLQFKQHTERTQILKSRLLNWLVNKKSEEACDV